MISPFDESENVNLLPPAAPVFIGVATSKTTHKTPSSGTVPATPTGLIFQALGSGRAFADIPDTAGATGYRWYVKTPGATDFVFKVETPTSEALLLALTSGVNEVRVSAIGSGGESAPSSPASLNVT